MRHKGLHRITHLLDVHLAALIDSWSRCIQTSGDHPFTFENAENYKSIPTEVVCPVFEVENCEHRCHSMCCKLLQWSEQRAPQAISGAQGLPSSHTSSYEWRWACGWNGGHWFQLEVPSHPNHSMRTWREIWKREFCGNTSTLCFFTVWKPLCKLK